LSILFQIEKALNQKSYNLVINILEKKLLSEPKNDIYFYLMGKTYIELKDYQKAFDNLKKAVDINPYGVFKNEIYSLLLNKIATSEFINTNRLKIVLDMYDKESVHARALYPLADTYFIDNMDKCPNPDYFLIPNWLSPSHPVYENIAKLKCPVVSLIVDRLLYAEEHVRGNLIYSDIIFVMENYAVYLFKKQGFKNVYYIPCAGSVGYDPLIYPKWDLEKKYDLVFLGNTSDSPIYKKRRKILDKLELLKDKYNILIKDVSNFDEYWTLINQSKIILDHTIDSKALNYRMFQALGIGSLCFVEENDMVEELFNINEIVMYNENNLEYLIDYYLSNLQKSEEISNNGFKKVINNYTHYHFLKMVVDKLNEKDYIFPSQKNNYKDNNLILNKGIIKYYQNKFSESLELFNLLESSQQNNNNIMVNLIKIVEIFNHQLDNQIENIYNQDKDDLIISFNYFLYLKYLKKKNPDFNQLKKIKSDYTGLIFLPNNDKNFSDNFKFQYGEIVFKFGIDSTDYKNNFIALIKNHSLSFNNE